MPSAEVWHIGIYRDEQTHKPMEYYNKLPTRRQLFRYHNPGCHAGDWWFGSRLYGCSQALGAKKIKFVGIIGAPEGVRRLQQVHPDVPIHLAALDDHLNEHGYITGTGRHGETVSLEPVGNAYPPIWRMHLPAGAC